MFNPQNVAAITAASTGMGITPASMLALGLKESSGNVFWTVGDRKLPAIRPETHHFYKQLSGAERDRAVAEGLAHPRRNAIKLPRSYLGIYQFYWRMQAINVEAAAAATSHGWGQVMGFNAASLGYRSALALANRAQSGLQGQTELVGRFLDQNGLIPFMNALPSKKAAEHIARRYNGPKWRENDYARGLVRNYGLVMKSSTGKLKPSGQSTLDLQKALTSLGYKPGDLDGIDGSATRAATRQFQSANGLVADGIDGPLTWEVINDQVTSKRQRTKSTTAGAGAAAATGVGATAIGLEAINYVRDLQTSFGSVLQDFGVAGPAASVVMAGGVGYFVYVRFFKVKQ